MTDLEINKRLALAIGWKAEHVLVFDGCMYVDVAQSPRSAGWRVFDHRDGNVIGPIAERYNCFPRRNGLANLWWPPQIVAGKNIGHMMHETPRKAIALAVIQGAKK